MPTGYTNGVAEGKVTSFTDFAMICARAMGVCVAMRDEPQDTEIPDEFEPERYHFDAQIDANKSLADFETLTDENIEKQCQVTFDEEMLRVQKRKTERDAKRLRYTSMLEKVNTWIPPTSEHVGIQKFMIEQLVSSIECDCSGDIDEPAKTTVGDWKKVRLESLKSDVVYHATKWKEEVERANQRSGWMRDFRKSLEEKTLSIGPVVRDLDI
jgi:hypothetical protein